MMMLLLLIIVQNLRLLLLPRKRQRAKRLFKIQWNFFFSQVWLLFVNEWRKGKEQKNDERNDNEKKSPFNTIAEKKVSCNIWVYIIH